MYEEIIKLAYKEWCRQQGVFENEKRYVIDEAPKSCTLYATYQNRGKYHNHLESQGRKLMFITGLDELIQCKLGFEYDVQSVYYKQEEITEQERVAKQEAVLRQGHERFLSLYSSKQFYTMKLYTGSH